MTRSSRTSMRDASTAQNVDEAVRNSGSRRRAVEAFVPWKKPCATETQVGNASPPKIVSKGRGNVLKEKLVPGRSATAASPSHLVLGRASRVQGSGNRMTRSPRKVLHPSADSPHASSATRQRSSASPQGQPILNTVLLQQPSTRVGKEQTSINQSSPSNLSMKSPRAMQEEIFTRNKERRFAILQGVKGREGRLTSENPTVHDSSLPRTSRSISSGGTRFNDGKEGVSNVKKLPAVEVEEQGMYEQDENIEEDVVPSSQGRQQSVSQALDFYRDGRIDSGSNEEEDDRETSKSLDLVEQYVDESVDYDRDGDNVLYPTEAERKKERRQERALLEKEGNRRRNEGLPRNFLLVDERTRKPYGVGVGDWRKELMLLSRDLDPAIGNINRQPESAVTEIAEWIQQTWEYSCPVKFEYVKEVIACGVTLRRVELWKKIRNGEKKPSDMSDRSWRTLQRQLDNPASIRKSENCRKANASRVNFGRTDPSGEIGIRQRLRKILRRSPDPDEVRVEMARDKGYGGRNVKRESELNIMHGSGRVGRQTMDIVHKTARKENSDDDRNVEKEDKESLKNDSNGMDVEDLGVPENGGKSTIETIASMSVEHISDHPFVQMMMQRLQALEAREADAKLDERRPSSGKDTRRSEEPEQSEGTPSTRRQLKKRKQG